MPNPVLGHWRRNGPRVRRLREALGGVCEVLAPREPARARLAEALDHEPYPPTEPPIVDPGIVDLKLLEAALEKFWAAYGALPAPPGCPNDHAKYRMLPEPLPRHQRVMLDQCYRVLLALYGWFTEWPGRLSILVVGATTRPPGMEDVFERYLTVAPPEVVSAFRAVRSRRAGLKPEDV